MNACSRLQAAAFLLALPVAAQDTARLEGLVVDPMHEPVANAEIVVEHDGVITATTRSDGSGAFLFTKVPAQYVLVRATTDAPDIGAELVDLWGEKRGFVTVRTGPARKVTGVVRDDLGEPVAGAWVLASPDCRDRRAHMHCRAQADAEGHYELEHVPFGEVLVRAWTDRHDAQAFAGKVDGRTDAALDCVVKRDEAEWCTFALDGATAEQLAAAELHVVARHFGFETPLPPPLARPRQVEPGQWQVNGWTIADDLHAWLVLPGATTLPCERVVPVGTGSLSPRLRLGEPEGRIRGTLRDADGAPVGGVPLLVQPMSRAPQINSRRAACVSRPDGTFTIQSPIDYDDRDGRFALRSMSPEVVLVGNNANAVWFVQAPDPNGEIELEVRPATTLRLQLVDPRGAPAPGCLVTLSKAETGGNWVAIGSGISGLDGGVVMRSLRLDPPTSLALVARGPSGFGTFETTLQPGSPSDLGTLELQPAAELRGAVVDRTGAPVAGALVSVKSMRRGLSPPVLLHADRRGRFAVRALPAGNYWVWSDAGAQGQSIDLDDGSATEVELTVES
ncbi:MAG: carboxypeptidase regulatory-like domain-containing protein [Planctomycetes bacterium]|nr:carboxypeptidase regulatory-like domain-containing protein [Planctomycetota bacterium]